MVRDIIIGGFGILVGGIIGWFGGRKVARNQIASLKKSLSSSQEANKALRGRLAQFSISKDPVPPIQEEDPDEEITQEELALQMLETVQEEDPVETRYNTEVEEEEK